jgi:hypothetical protein
MLDKQILKLLVHLSGGLGNQMFQYACARSLALRCGLELVLDNWSGFVRDSQYKRHYELSAFPIQARVTKRWERLPIWLYRWQNSTSATRSSLLETRWYGQFLTETEFSFLQALQNISINRDTWITGYWQSPLYFHEHAESIRAELMPPPAQATRFIDIANEIRRTESVALGVRVYEESIKPSANAHGSRIKTAGEISGAVKTVLRLHPKARVFVFCTHRAPLLHELGLPSDTVFVTRDDGFDGTIETLWLLTQCRHHIFTNSSYYWWGAWLSAATRGVEGQTISAADNFYNRNALCPEWQTF